MKLKKRIYAISLSLLLLSTLHGLESDNPVLSTFFNVIDEIPLIDKFNPPRIIPVSGTTPVIEEYPLPNPTTIETARSGVFIISYWSASVSTGDYNTFRTYRAYNPSMTGKTEVGTQDWNGPLQQITYYFGKTSASNILGSTYFETEFEDDGGHIGTSPVFRMIMQDTTSPILNNPTTPVTLEVSGSRTISWSWTDNWTANSGAIWRVYQNTACSGTITASGTWGGGGGSRNQVVSPTVDTSYTMCVWDSQGNSPDSDIVFVDTSPAVIPVLNAPADQTMEDGSATREFAWTWTDTFNNPTDSGDWIVRSQTSAFGGCTTGSTINSGTWSGTAGSRTEPSLSPSVTTYYCIRVTDDGNNWDDDFTTITVTTSTIPVLNAPSDHTMEDGSATRSFVWTWTDNFNNPTDTGDWVVRSGTGGALPTCNSGNYPAILNSGTWSGTTGSRTQSSLSPSITTYYCIRVTDETGNIDDDITQITVSASADPVVSSPADQTMEDGSATRDFSWTWSDTFNNPVGGDASFYVRSSPTTFGGVCVSGTQIVSQSWDGTGDNYDLLGYSPSVTTYYCIRVTDDTGNIDDDEVILSVTSAQAPIDNNPVDLTLEDGIGTRDIAWTWTDNFNNPLNTGDYEVRSATGSLPTAVCDVANYPTSEVGVTTWDGTAGSYSHTGLTPSATTYYCIRIIDEAENIDDDFVTLAITSAGAPVLNAPADLTLEDGIGTRDIAWTWTDNFNNPTASGSWEIRSSSTTFSGVCTGGSLDNSGTWETTSDGQTHASLSPSVSTYYCIRVTDEANVFDDDEVQVTIITSANPVLNTPTDPTMEDGISTRDIAWTWTDNFNNPAASGSWEIRSSSTTFSGVCTGGSLDNSGTWETTSDGQTHASLSPSVSTYYCIRVTDEAGNFADSFANILVTASEAPIFRQRPEDLDFEKDATGFSIFWEWDDNFDNLNVGPSFTIRYNTATNASSCDAGFGAQDSGGNWAGTYYFQDYNGIQNNLGVVYWCIRVIDETGNFVDDMVTVTLAAKAAPVVTASPSDATYEDGNIIVRNIQWTATDSYAGNYIIESQIDGGGYSTIRTTTQWFSGSPTTNYDVGSLAAGTWDFRITFTENLTKTVGQSIQETMTLIVIVAVDPIIVSEPPNINYEDGNTDTRNVDWTATDNGYPDTYRIERRKNGGAWVEIQGVASWTNNTAISAIDVGSLTVGTWEFRVQFNESTAGADGSFTYSSNLVIAVSASTAPTITPLADITKPWNDQSTINIQWSFSDNENGYSWNIRQSTDNSSWGSVLDSGDWSGTGGSSTPYDVGISTIEYYYRILVVDNAANLAYDYIWVGEISSIDKTPFEIGGGETISERASLFWAAFNDVALTNAEVWRNETQIVNLPSHSNGTYYYYDLTEGGTLLTGDYNFTIKSWDSTGDVAVVSYLVSYFDDGPNVYLPPADFSYTVGNTGNIVKWGTTDRFPDTYTLTRNGTQIASGTWVEGVYVSINVDGLSINTYEYTITLYDIAGNFAQDTVYVTVSPDLNKPTFTALPADLLLAQGSSNGNLLIWNFTDASAGLYTLYRNGSGVASGVWSGITSLQLTIITGSLTLHNYTLVLADDYGNEISDQTWAYTVVDDGNPIPIKTSYPGNRTIILGSTGNTLRWTAVDNHPWNAQVRRNGTRIYWADWDLGEYVTIEIDGLAVGIWKFQTWFYDTLLNSNTPDEPLNPTSVYVTVIP